MTGAVSSRSDTRSRIVEVAARLLQEQGPAAVTTRGVAEAAGVQAPTLYRLFGDKDGLLDAVAEHVLATYVSTKETIVAAASADDVDPLEDLRAGWDTYVDFGLANPTLYALLSDPVRAARSPAAQSGRHVLESRVHRVAVTGRLRVSEQRAVELIHAAGTGAVLTLLSAAPGERHPDLADDLFEAVLGRIVTDSAALAADGPVAAVVALRAVAPQLAMLSGAERQLLTEWLDRATAAMARDSQANNS
jgi:AcrR family transcriptional regulator